MQKDLIGLDAFRVFLYIYILFVCCWHEFFGEKIKEQIKMYIYIFIDLKTYNTLEKKGH